MLPATSQAGSGVARWGGGHRATVGGGEGGKGKGGELGGMGDGGGMENGTCLSLSAGLILRQLGKETCRSAQVFKAW